MTAYRALVERGGDGWRVRLGNVELPARDLADVEPRCRRFLAETWGEAADGATIDVEVLLPSATQVRLELIAQLCEDIVQEGDAAHGELVELGVSLMDAARLLAYCYRVPRPLTVSSRELAVAGLDGHPDAVGVEWSDHAHFVTVKCRRHVDATRHHYNSVAPDDECALIYDPGYLRCDWCPSEGNEPFSASSSGGAAG